MYCSECGTAVSADDTSCPKCGATVPSTYEHTTAGPGAHDSTIVIAANAPDFRDPAKLTQWLKVFLYASIAIDFIAMFSGILQYQLLSDFNSGVYGSEALATTAADSNDQRQQVIGLFQVGIAITTIILFARWIYRANFNVRQLGAQGLKFSPGWSVGYYFIPILHLWKPYQAMREIWQASKNPASWATVERGSILPWWWLFFVAAGLLGQTSFRISLRAKEINELILSTGITIAADLVSIPAAIIALVLVKQIFEMQMSHVQPLHTNG
jgi:hypothetical protein